MTVTVPLKVAWIEIAAPTPYVPLAVEDVTFVMEVGATRENRAEPAMFGATGVTPESKTIHTGKSKFSTVAGSVFMTSQTAVADPLVDGSAK